MTTFSYTSGDPTHLTGGVTANMADISGSFDDVKTFLNGGNIDSTNLATSADPVTLKGDYRTISEATLACVGAAMGPNVWLPTLGTAARTGFADGSVSVPPVLISLTSTDYAVSGLTTKFRVVASTVTNATASGISFTFGLYPVTVAGGASAITVTVGTVVSGSTVTRTTPSASTAYQDASADFTPPSAGVYALGVSTSGAGTAGAFVAMTCRLERHHI